MPAAKTIVDTYEGQATVAAYSVVHGRDGGAEWGVAICDVGGDARCYARMETALDEAEAGELVGTPVTIATSGDANVLHA